MASRATAYRPMIKTDQRDARRFEAQVTRASLREVTQEPAGAGLVDISIYGCRIACDTDVETGEPVWLRLNGSLPIAAKVVWNRGGLLGCRFDTPIGRPLLRSLTIGEA